MISKNHAAEDLWQCIRESNTTTLFEDAWAKVEAGITTVEEVISKIPHSQYIMPVSS